MTTKMAALSRGYRPRIIGDVQMANAFITIVIYIIIIGYLEGKVCIASKSGYKSFNSEGIVSQVFRQQKKKQQHQNYN